MNTPQVNNTVPRGYYNTDSNTIVVNFHPSVGTSFGNVISTTFHEAVHGLYFNKTRGMDPYTVRDKAKTGEISTTAAYAYVNLTDLFYTRTGKNYFTQPHEELAFSGNEFLEREMRKRGIKVDASLPSSHSTIQNITKYGL